jgi:predicted nucleic acid-binding Zn finger protein
MAKSCSNTENLNHLKLITNLETNLLEKLKETYLINQQIPDSLLESLYFFYKNPLLEALHLLDKYNQTNCVTEIYNENITRKIYQVIGSTGYYYYLFSNHSFCTCSSFKFNILKNSEYIYCKHIIVIKLSLALNKFNKKLVNETEISDLIKLIR